MSVYAIGFVILIATGAAVVYAIARLLMWVFTRPGNVSSNTASNTASNAAEAALGEDPDRPTGGGSSGGYTAAYIAVAVVCVIITFAFYYFFYRTYTTGQDTCAALYPGNSLQALRMREECKDRKRGNWALPAAALILSNN